MIVCVIHQESSINSLKLANVQEIEYGLTINANVHKINHFGTVEHVFLAPLELLSNQKTDNATTAHKGLLQIQLPTNASQDFEGLFDFD